MAQMYHALRGGGGVRHRTRRSQPLQSFGFPLPV